MRPHCSNAEHTLEGELVPPTGQLQTVQLVVPLHLNKNVASLQLFDTKILSTGRVLHSHDLPKLFHSRSKRL